MVKGRAVRKGLCEECAEGRAVLQCSECQECTHFCPQCWVHVHFTRRRKAHIPIPMVAEAKVAASGRKNLPEIQYPTHHSPNKAAHKCAEAIQHLDYTSVSDFGQIKNSATSASLQGDRLSTIVSTLDATPKEKKPPNARQHPMKKSHNQKDREKTTTSPALLGSSSLKANEIQQENIPIKMIPECTTDAVDEQITKQLVFQAKVTTISDSHATLPHSTQVLKADESSIQNKPSNVQLLTESQAAVKMQLAGRKYLSRKQQKKKEVVQNVIITTSS